MSDLILAAEHAEPKFERVHRTQTIDAGQYVLAPAGLPDELIEPGEVLAIADVAYVDNIPHTIKLRAHPRHYGHQDKRRVLHKDWKLTTHAFLLKDFLNNFVQISTEEALSVRAQEQQDAMSRINEMQADIQDVQTNPDRLKQIIADGLAARREARGEAPPTTLPALTDGLPPLTLGTAIARGVTEASMVQLRGQADHQRDIVSIKAEWLKEATQRLSAAFAAMAPYYTEQVDIPMARARAMQEQVTRITDGLQSLDLYLGKDVLVRRVASGSSAPEDEPLTIVQRKLVMSEEMAVYLEVDDQTDYNSVDDFLHALGHNAALANQVFLAPRCVVCMAATRQHVAYKDTSSFESMVHNLENRKVFLLVRDGENIFYVSSPVESHLEAARLFPTKDETDKIFRGVDGSAITFESLRYTPSLSEHERQSLHYRRLLILLCGLDHREKLFGGFYTGGESLNFVSMAFQESHMRFISDDDEATLLPGAQRPAPVMDWLRGMNRYLTSGARVFGVWGDIVSNESACPGGVQFGAQYEGEPGVRVAFKGDKGIAVEVDVTINSKARKVKAYPRRYHRGTDCFDCSLPIPYLVLDAVEPEQLHFYIHDRFSRVENVEYIRLFKRALAWLSKEREAERPVRERMLQAITDNHICPPETAGATLSHAIRLWRSANRGKNLPTLLEEGSSGWNEVLDVVYLLEHGSASQSERVQRYLDSLGCAAVRLCVSGRARLIAYVEPKTDERDDRLTPHVWLHRIVLRLGKRSVNELSRAWERLPAFDASEHQIASFGNEAPWLATFSGFSSFKQKQELFRSCEHGVSFLRELVGNEQRLEEFAEQYLLKRRQTKGTYGRVPEIGLAVPIGLVHMKQGSRDLVQAICLTDGMASDSIYSLLEGPFKESFKDKELSRYAHPEHMVSRLVHVADRRMLGTTLNLSLIPKKYALEMASAPLQANVYSNRWGSSHNVLSFDGKAAMGMATIGPNERYWFAGGIEPGVEGGGLDSLVGTEGKLNNLQPGQLWLYTPNKEQSVDTEYFAEIDGLALVIHGIEHWDAQLLACWLTAEERQLVLQRFAEAYPDAFSAFDTKARVHAAARTFTLPFGTHVKEAVRPEV
ncbi:hypothetical protein HX798_23115 [Pseudomonas putida]|uniref:Uncharacterized protein n=1 Tax=Pseudomonas putida TaxID=303 RepID=A0A7Y7ZDX1_PSEPU|nr:hypothetical protein [Pseudomonas putida]NWC83156.1 hypothetical protein [Pseudomonas putida]